MPSGSEQPSIDLSDPSIPVLEVVSNLIRTPPDAFDAIRVWKGIDPATEVEFFVEAAAYQGRPVYYEYFPADQFLNELTPGSARSPFLESGEEAILFLSAVVYIVGIVFCIFNLLTGRGDRRGALRMALAVFYIKMAVWLMHAHHTVNGLDSSAWVLGFAQATQMAAQLWIWYIAMEPFVRKLWPKVMISWQRILDGRISDPLVGRDLLLGLLFGVLCVVCAQASAAVQISQNALFQGLKSEDPVSLMGPVQLLGSVLMHVTQGLNVALFGLVMLVSFRAVLGTERRATAALTVLFSVIMVIWRGGGVSLSWLPLVVWVAMAAFVLVRIGLFAHFVQSALVSLLLNMPLTLYTGHWYFAHGMLAVGLVFCLGLYGFYTSVGGRPYFAKLISDGSS